jgi:hypothetical protein
LFESPELANSESKAVNVSKLSEAADARVDPRFQATVSADGLFETFLTASFTCSADVQRAFRGAPDAEIYTTLRGARKKKA